MAFNSTFGRWVSLAYTERLWALTLEERVAAEVNITNEVKLPDSKRKVTIRRDGRGNIVEMTNEKE